MPTDYVDIRVNDHLVCRVRRVDLTIQHRKGGETHEASLRPILEAAGWRVARSDEPSVLVLAE